MIYTEFVNTISRHFVDISLDHTIKLWEIYQEKLRTTEENLYEYNEILLEQMIHAYPYLMDSNTDIYMEILDHMMVIYKEIYFYPLTYFDDQAIKKTKAEVESILSIFQISSNHEVLFFDCLQTYIDKIFSRRRSNYMEEDQIKQVYENELSYTITQSLTSEERQNYIDLWMKMYDELSKRLSDVPKYVIKNAILHAYDNQFNITYENRFSLAFGLCQMKNISSYEEAICYFEKIYKNKEYTMIQNKYFCYGVLECLDWTNSDYFKSSSSDFMKGATYFKDYEEIDKLLVIAENVNDAWQDLSIKQVTSDFQAGLLYQAYQLLLKEELLEEDIQEDTTWYEKIYELVYKNIDTEIEVAKKIYQELMSNPTITLDLQNCDAIVKQKIITSYEILNGNVSYEERRNLVVASLYSETQMNMFSTLSFEGLEEIAQVMIECYKQSNFLNGRYKNKQVESYLYDLVQNYHTIYSNPQIEQDIFDEIDLLVQSVCKTREEMNAEIKMIDEIYEKLYLIMKDTTWNITKRDILQALSNSYTTILLKDGKLLDYSHRFNLTLGFLCARYTSSSIHELSRAIERIVVGDPVQDVYFIYGMIVEALEDYQYEEDFELNEVIQAGMDYSIDPEDMNIIWTIAESLSDYTHDAMQPKKEVDFIKGIIYGTYKKGLQPTKTLVKEYLN